MDHAALTAMNNRYLSSSQGPGERAALIPERVVVRGDDHRRREPREVGQKGADSPIIPRDARWQPLLDRPPQRVSVQSPSMPKLSDASCGQTKVGVGAGEQQTAAAAVVVA